MAPANPDQEGIVVGIDLGTSNSLVARMLNGVPTVVRNSLGELLTPSVVSVSKQGEIQVGASALARRVTHPEETAATFKRDMGTDTKVRLGRSRFSPEQLSSLVLRQLREDTEAATGERIREAVVTVPAYFGEAQRRATARACELAGLPVERIINEPTAAALAYGLQRQDAELQVVVLDLGGGTFDVSVLEIIEGVVEIQSTAGDSALGGEDFLTAIVDLVRLKAGLNPKRESARERAALEAACERAKRQLSHSESARVALADRKVELEITRAEVEPRWDALIRRMTACIRRALSDAQLLPTQIEEVLLVGGATRMPIIEQLASDLFGRLPRRELPPDEAVALGAAVQAAIKDDDAAVEDLVVTDIAPFTLGVDTSHKSGRHYLPGVFSPIIDRGTVLPASRSSTYYTIDPMQTSMRLSIYQGEHAICDKNTKIGEIEVGGIPPDKAEAQAVECRFTYDLNGLLEVEATVLSTGRTSSVVLGQAQRGMSDAELADARKAMARLKFHPRDALPNTTAINRAEALYATLTGPARDELSTYIAILRMALEQQEPKPIQAAREELILVTENLQRYAETSS